jgi:heat shock protein 4
LLFEKFGEEFFKKYGCDPRNSVKPRLRMLDSIEKTRKLLTSNKEADINCESLMEDEDFMRTFKREELEELIQPVILNLKENLKEAITKSGLNPD